MGIMMAVCVVSIETERDNGLDDDVNSRRDIGDSMLGHHVHMDGLMSRSNYYSARGDGRRFENRFTICRHRLSSSRHFEWPVADGLWFEFTPRR